jgi:hypothetical protein
MPNTSFNPPANGKGKGATITKKTKVKADPLWPNPKDGSKRAKAPRGAKLTIAENVRLGEPKVTGNNIGTRIKFRKMNK